MHLKIIQAAGRMIAALGLALGLFGCAGYPGWMASSGPSQAEVKDAEDSTRLEGIQLVDVTDSVARALAARKKQEEFAAKFSDASLKEILISSGDTLEIWIWESPPTMLFGQSASQESITARAGAQGVALPSQMVGADGKIVVPFAGQVRVAGLSARQAENKIAESLEGKANQPQVLVRPVRNSGSQVTVFGDVNTSTRMSLTPQGERVLDALAAAGGVKQDVSRTAVKLSRRGEIATMPLDAIISNPAQNIRLKPGDVVTALFQPNSFSVLGATGKNAEIPFEAQGISLAQALARAGGPADHRADARAVFVFRFEDPEVVPAPETARRTIDNKAPVIYQVNLRDPAAFFVTQNFPMENGDLLYVANAPSAEFQKFLNMLLSVTMPALTFGRAFD